jgi:hypothetical protein
MSRRYSQAVSWILGALIFFHLVLIFSPWHFTMPRNDLDASWVAVLTHGASQGWQWGRDIVFNYGPSGFLWNRLFDEHLVVAAIGLQLLLVVCLAWGVTYLLFPLPPLATLVAYLSVALGVFLSRDGFFFMLPLLVALGHFRLPNPASIMALLPLAVATGIGSTVKLTYGVAGLIILGIVDAHRLASRRWPLYIPIMLLAFFTFYLLAGQELAHFPNFLRLSLDIISGHSSAMALAGSWRELLAFIGLSGMALLLLVWNEWQGKRTGTRPGYWRTLALFLALSSFWLINFKQGFVRHDLHSLAAWGGLAAVAAMAAATVFWQPPARFGLLAGMLAIAMSAALLGLWRWQLEGGHTMSTLVRVVFHDQPNREWQNFREWVRSPEDWKARLKQQRDTALARIRDQHPLPPLQGSVDVIPSIQSVILAHGYDYRPRPVFQEYVAYTPKLIAANRAFLRSDRAPDYLFFSPGSIDDRYPSSAEGAVWPDILRLYRLERMVVGDLALLARRAEPLAELLDGDAIHTLHFGESLNLADQTTVFARIKVEKTGFGKLANLLFKPAPVFLSMKLHDGVVKTHHLIPEMASEGFLLSPYIQSSTEFGLLATGQLGSLINKQVEEIIIRTSNLGQFYYQESISLNLQSLRTRNLSGY